MTDQAEEKQLARVPWILWGALFSCVFVYGIVAYFFIGNPSLEATDPQTLAMIFYALAAISVLLFPGIIILRKVMITKRIEAGAFEDLTQLRVGIFTPNMVSWALSESVAVFGFLLTFLSLNMNYYFGFASLSLLYLVIFRPNFMPVKEEYYRVNPERRNS